MVRRRLWMAIASTVCLVSVVCSQLATHDKKTPRITKEELKALLGNPGVIILDVRVTEQASPNPWEMTLIINSFYYQCISSSRSND
jgi:hypothetical protein